jgi:putative acyl-CoA dehydrogenase
VIQAALLKQHAPDAVFGAFCAGRLQQGSDVFGSLAAGCDLDALIARAQLH